MTGGGGAVEVHLAHAEGGGVQQVLRLVDKGLNNITQVLGQLPGLKDAHPVLLKHQDFCISVVDPDPEHFPRYRYGIIVSDPDPAKM